MRVSSFPATVVARLRRCVAIIVTTVACLALPAAAGAAPSTAWVLQSDAAFTSSTLHAMRGAASGTVRAPFGMAPVANFVLTPDGSTAYLASPTAGVLTVDLTAIAPTAVPLMAPPIGGAYDLTISTNGATLFVREASGTIYRVNTASGQVEATNTALQFSFNSQRNHLAISPDGSRLYVITDSDNQIHALDAATLVSEDSASMNTVATDAGEIALSPDGSTIWVTGVWNSDGVILKYNAADLLHLERYTLTAADAASGKGMPLLVTPDGSAVVAFTGAGANPAPGTVHHLDVASEAITSNTLGASTSAWTAIGLTPSADALLVVADDGVLRRLRPDASGTDLVAPEPIAAGNHFWRMVIAPNQPAVAALAAVPPQVAFAPTELDASGTTDEDVASTRFDWDFGDGTTMTGTDATPRHAYAAPGTYSVTVSATDAQGCSTERISTGRTLICNGSATLPLASRTVTVDKRAASLAVNCTPESIMLGDQATCTATVADSSPGTKQQPTGTVSFVLNGPATLSAASCQLPTSGTPACSVTMTASSNMGGTTSLIATYSGSAMHHVVGGVSGGGPVNVPTASGVRTKLRKLITMSPRRTISVPCRLDNVTLKRCTAVLRDTRGRVLARAARTVAPGTSATTLKLRLNARARARVTASFPGIAMRLTVTATQRYGAPTLTTSARTRIRPRVALVRQVGAGQFIGDSSWSTQTARAWAKRIIPQLRGARKVVCNGYTAGTLNSTFARRLSRARALEMCFLLKQHGMKAPYELKARANANPRASNAVERGRILNRRVELQVYR